MVDSPDINKTAEDTRNYTQRLNDALFKMSTTIYSLGQATDKATIQMNNARLKAEGLTEAEIEYASGQSDLAYAMERGSRNTRSLSKSEEELLKKRIHTAKIGLDTKKFETEGQKRLAENAMASASRRVKASDFENKRLESKWMDKGVMPSVINKVLGFKESLEDQYRNLTGKEASGGLGDLALPIAIQGIIMAVKLLIASTRQALQTSSLIYQSSSSQMGASADDVSVMATKYAQASLLAGLEGDKMVGLMSTALSEYGMSLKNLSGGNKLGVVADQVIGLTQAAAVFGMEADELTRKMFDMAGKFGISADRVKTSFISIAEFGKVTNLTSKDALELMSGQAEALQATSIGFDESMAQTYAFVDALKSYGSATDNAGGVFAKWSTLYPNLAKAAMKAFDSITTEAYLAYKGKPVRNIGEAFYGASVNAGPMQRMLAQREALMPFAMQGSRSKEDIAGRFALLSGNTTREGMLISEVISQLTPEQTRGMTDKNAMQMITDSLKAKGGVDAATISAVGTAMNVTADPMHYIKIATEQMAKTAIQWFGAWAINAKSKEGIAESNALRADLDTSKIKLATPKTVELNSRVDR